MAYRLQKQILMNNYGHKCMLCKRSLKSRDCTYHHIIPKSCGGEATVENGAILCPECQSIVHLFEYGEEGYTKLTKVIKKAKKSKN